MVNFVCLECGYRFSADLKNKKCPYCNGEHAEKDKSAEELVNELEVE